MTFLYALCMIYAVQDCPSTQEEDSDSSCTWGGRGDIYIHSDRILRSRGDKGQKILWQSVPVFDFISV